MRSGHRSALVVAAVIFPVVSNAQSVLTRAQVRSELVELSSVGLQLKRRPVGSYELPCGHSGCRGQARSQEWRDCFWRSREQFLPDWRRRISRRLEIDVFAPTSA